MFALTRDAAFRALTFLLLMSCSDYVSAQQGNSPNQKRTAIVVVPAGWESATQNWQAYRKGQGYSIEVVTAQATADATQVVIAEAAKPNRDSDVFVLLAADALPINQQHLLEAGEPYVPTFYLPSQAIVNFGGEPEIATDYPYSDLDSDGIGECAVGRIPANNPKQLAQILDRSIQYEQRSIRGNWQYEMNLVAGVGGFSMLADMAISGFAKAVLMESLPKEFQLFIAQASPHSPYFPPAAQFRDAVVEQLNRNSLLWVYMGHGSIQELDRVQFKDELYPILSGNDVAALKSSRSSSLAFLFACYSGAFDAPMPCLGEMILKNNEGPVAVIGATRVSMPYGMGVLAKEMLHEAFVNHTSTIGEILRNAKEASTRVDPNEVIEGDTSLDAMMSSMATSLSPADHNLAQELLEHRWLINLIGDPTLTLPKSQSLDFAIALDPATNTINLKGNADLAGELVVQVLCDRGTISDHARNLVAAEAKANKEHQQVSDQDAMDRYHAVNDTILVETNKAVSKGEFNAQLKLPDDIHGSFQVRCSLCNRKQSAVGATSFPVTNSDR